MLKLRKVGLALVMALMLSLSLFASGAFAQQVIYNTISPKTTITVVTVVTVITVVTAANARPHQTIVQNGKLQAFSTPLAHLGGEEYEEYYDWPQGCYYGDCSHYRICNDWWCYRRR